VRCGAGWVSICTPSGEILLSRHAGPSAQHQYQLFDRAADNFAMLFMNIPDKQKDAFFENYHDALAQSIFAVWWTAFPKSRFKFEKPAFRAHICGMIAEWTTGEPHRHPRRDAPCTWFTHYITVSCRACVQRWV
jgi:hypothetical protein